MTREEAIIRLKEGEPFSEIYDPVWDEALKMAISALSDYDKMQKISLDLAFENDELMNKSRWIPVSERLPEKEGLYLVSVKNEHDRRYSKTCWFHGNGNWFARQDVIAWQPLPEPYKAEKGGE